MGRKNRKHQSRPPVPQKSARSSSLSGGAGPKTSVLIWARLLLILCLGIAAYLAWSSLSGGSIAGCGPESGCDKVLQSRWAYWFGLPVSLPSLVVYAGLLWASFKLSGRGTGIEQQRGFWMVTVLCLTVLAAALWFVSLQIFVIHSFCKFCLAAHAFGMAAALLLLRSVRLLRNESGRGTVSGFFPKAILASGLAVAVLVAGQALVTKARFKVESTVSSPSPAQPLPAPRVLSIHKGLFELRLDELPVIGNAHAARVMVSLFDYTCHYCRDMHGLLLQAQRQFSNQLAIINLPMPLDANCNHLMQRTPSAHQNACEYARLGLAVWRAKPAVSADFDHWVFAPPTPPPIPEVRQHAEQLVGKENFERALADSWVESQLKMNVAIYAANTREMRSGSMPQLIIGDAISVGPLDRVEQLYSLLQQHLKL